jgi:hypothetical protein
MRSAMPLRALQKYLRCVLHCTRYSHRVAAAR